MGAELLFLIAGILFGITIGLLLSEWPKGN